MHRYPTCWRCKTPLVFRVVDDWFISRRRDPPADDRRERDRRVDAVLLLEADGRLAPQHGRLEHLAQAVLRPAAADLPVRVRRADRDRLAGRARGAGDGRARRARRSCTGPGSTTSSIACSTAGRRSRASRRSATPGSTPASSRSRRSVGTTRMDAGRVRHRRRARPDEPTCRTTPTGRSGSPPTGSPRCASRSGCGSTPSRSCR